ncbi:MAG: AEC family transporter [Anaerolineae bacterium]|nr:AEC family transporter [Anaerolineae bacterium]
MSDQDVPTSVVVNLLLVVLGYLLVRLGVVEQRGARAFNRLVLYVTLPATTLLAIAGSALDWRTLALPLLFIVAPMALWTLGLVPARALRLSRTDRGTFVVALCGFMGSLAYPFVEAAYGVDGLRALAIADLGNAVAIFGMAYYLSFRYSTQGQFDIARVARALATFLPLHACWIALVLAATGLEPGGIVGSFLEALARINSPLMLLSLGMHLELNLSRDEARTLAVHAVYKYGIGFGLALFIALVLPYRGPERAVAFLLPLMPAPLSTLLYSVEQGLNARLAAMFVSLDILISLAITAVAIVGFRSAF